MMDCGAVKGGKEGVLDAVIKLRSLAYRWFCFLPLLNIQLDTRNKFVI